MNGTLITCDICGTTVFIKRTGTGEADGGFTRWNQFEEAPGWTRISSYGFEQVCPECAKEVGDSVERTVRDIRDNTIPCNPYAFKAEAIPGVLEEDLK
jgi:hypothetical protein